MEPLTKVARLELLADCFATLAQSYAGRVEAGEPVAHCRAYAAVREAKVIGELVELVA